MEIKFKNITKCTPNLYNKFLKFHNKRYRKREILTFLLLIVLILYMIIFNVVNHNYSIAFCVIAFAAIYFLFNANYQKKVVKEELESSKIKNQEEIEFYFYEKYYFTIKINNQKKKIRYYKLYRINSDKQNFYLYIDKTHAFIVSKMGFVKGTANEFKKFISKKCKFKYSEKTA